MPNHTNRSRRSTSPAANPAPAAIRAAREAAGMTQSQAAALVHSTLRAWQRWESGDRRMHPAIWELFRLKVTSVDATSTETQTTMTHGAT
ncbi:MAG: helix-turn-helix domain-containing protein [Burkholderiaceae bacterium]|nr:helix-turn-helix domain-containing protein [Burkholderiaceae bacterium]